MVQSPGGAGVSLAKRTKHVCCLVLIAETKENDECVPHLGFELQFVLGFAASYYLGAE